MHRTHTYRYFYSVSQLRAVLPAKSSPRLASGLETRLHRGHHFATSDSGRSTSSDDTGVCPQDRDDYSGNPAERRGSMGFDP